MKRIMQVSLALVLLLSIAHAAAFGAPKQGTRTDTFCTAAPSGIRSPVGGSCMTSWFVSSEVSVNP